MSNVQESMQNNAQLKALIDERSERLGKTNRKTEQGELRYHGLFHEMPIALAELDYSDCKPYLAELLKSGVKDLRHHLRNNRETFLTALSKVKVTDLNQSYVNLWGFKDMEEWFSWNPVKRVNTVMVGDAVNITIQEMVAAAEGLPMVESVGRIETIHGKEKHLHHKWSVFPGCEKDYSRVIKYIIDITEQKHMQNELKDYRDRLEELVEERTKELEREISAHRKTEGELKISEEQYHDIFNDIPIAIMEMDYSAAYKYLRELKSLGISNLESYFESRPDEIKRIFSLEKLTKVNKQALRMSEVNKSDVTGAIMDSFVETIWSEYIEQSAKDVILFIFNKYVLKCKTMENEYEVEHKIITQKGNIKYLFVKIAFFTGGSSNTLRGLVYHIDITKAKQAEEDINNLLLKERQLSEQLRQELERRVYLIRALVHELKTPLTPLLASTELLIAESRQEPLLSLSKEAYSGASLLNKRIDELFDISKGEIGALKLKYASFNPVLMLQEVANYMKAGFFREGKSLDLELAENLPVIQADKERLKQIILNLLDNALKFTPKEAIITLKAKRDDSYIKFEVQDTGFGISDNRRQNLFKANLKYRSKAQKHSGLGLGLILCKTLVELHGGHIWVESEYGSGSTFIFTVPIKKQVVKVNPKKQRLLL